MKKPTIYLLTVFLFMHLRAANCADMTMDEISLMLRSGFSSETIIEDLARGRLYGDLTAAREQEFKQLGASPALIEALKSGKYAASGKENRQFNQRQIAIAERQNEAALHRERQQIEQRRTTQQAARYEAAQQEEIAAQAEARLNQRVINALSAPIGEFGGSPDQERVRARAKAVAEQEFPHINRDDPHGLDRRHLIDQLISDERFVRDTLTDR